MKALLIAWNETTGKRAGNINPKDPNFQCYGWQRLNGADSLEIRLVMDGKVDNFRGVEGITVLENDEEIDNAIDQRLKPRRYLVSETIILKSMEEKGLKVSDELLNMDMGEIIDYAIAHSLAGVKERKLKKVRDVIR